MKTVKIKRRLHKTDISLLEYKIDSLEAQLANLRKNLNLRTLDENEINHLSFGLHHGIADLLNKTKAAVDSVGKEMD